MHTRQNLPGSSDVECEVNQRRELERFDCELSFVTSDLHTGPPSIFAIGWAMACSTDWRERQSKKRK
jgi:hypothetical protein